MKYQYVKSRIEDSINELCIGKGDARSRLLSVNEQTISLLDIHFPPEVLSDWHNIQEKMTQYGPVIGLDGRVREGAVENTMRRIKNITASRIAEDILALHKNLKSY